MKTLREQVLSTLRERILAGKIKPDERLVERDLAKELGVSRTPVRECFPVLEQQGLVRNSPGLGVVVRRISVREIRDSLEVRDALDALAAKRAAENRSDEDIVLIEAALRLHELAVARGEDEAITETDSRFHYRIHEAAANGVLLNVRNAFVLYEGFYFHPNFYQYTPKAFERSVRRHRAMFKAIRSQDPEKAVEASRLHIQDAVKLLKDEGEETKTN